MTTDANELTPRATGSARPNSALPTMPSGEVRAFVDALSRLGFDLTSLLTASGISRADLDDPDASLPCAALGAVLKGACEQRRFANLASHLAFQTPIGAFPLLDYLVVTTDTVGDALGQLERYFHITSSPCRLKIVPDGDSIRLLVEPGDDHFNAQYNTAIAVHHLRDETAQRLRVSYVSLMREPDDRLDLERLLRCPVHAPATWSGIEFPKEAMETGLTRRDPILRAVLEGRAAGEVAVPNTEPDSAAKRVRAFLATRIGEELPDIVYVARHLAMAPRTLQRRLADEGASYKDLIDLTRREAAERLLSDRSLGVAEVGYLLGFSEPSAFHRAFKRWLGISPLEYRRSKPPLASRFSAPGL